jgi:hypothetical protein
MRIRNTNAQAHSDLWGSQWSHEDAQLSHGAHPGAMEGLWVSVADSRHFDDDPDPQ